MNNIDDGDDEIAVALCVYDGCRRYSIYLLPAVTILMDTWYNVTQREAYTIETTGRPRSWITSTAALS